ncbi:MAG: hypothetical protein ACKO37_04795 [Vampirovibrionales bacterium]
MPLIVLPSTPATQQASAYLKSLEIDHQCIPMPPRLNYTNGSSLAIYTTAFNAQALSTLLTQQRFVVMRVFKDFVLQPGDVS